MQIIKRLLRKCKREAIHIYRQSKDAFNLNESFFKNARGCRIVVYHGICLENHTKFNGIFLTKVAFEKHLQFYKKYFHIVSLDDFYKKNFDENKFNVCITFDDGYLNNYKYVLPLMEQYEIPMTFFITAIRNAGYDILWNDFLGIITKYGPQVIKFDNESFFKVGNQYISKTTKRPFVEFLRKKNFGEKDKMMKQLYELVPFRNKRDDYDFWQQLNESQITELAASPYSTIGSHGYYHNDLSEILIDDCRQELINSKHFLEKLCHKEINALAFPYGHYTREVVAEAKKTGYDQLYALDFHYNEDKTDEFMRERFIVNPYISVINQMYATVKGKYE